jgi:hypothetical protein
VLRNCPFDALAREHTELVCGMNLAIMNAVTDQLHETALVARLEPAPDRCCVVLVPALSISRAARDRCPGWGTDHENHDADQQDPGGE